MSDDRISELWLKIDKLHIKHLQAEETPAKLEIRKRLEGYVTEYLNLVPYDRKFLSIRTGDIILQSSRWIHGFTLTKAASAFRTIERYAANLINQPWRQEFWSIKQYSGFYKDNVQSSLSGVEKFFYDMGYSEIDTYCMELLGTKQYGNPVNVDAATSVARDCLLASMECNILADIHNGVLQFQITLKELLEFRQDHICTALKAIEELIYRKNKALYRLNPGFIPLGYPGLPGYKSYQGMGHQFHLQAPGFSQENPPSSPEKERPRSTEVVVMNEALKNMTTLGFGKMDGGCYMASKSDRTVSKDKYSSPVCQKDGQDRSIKQIRQRETPQRSAQESGYTQQKKEVRTQQKTSVESREGNFWKCRICTFHNSEDKSNCEMCDKTLNQPTARKSQIDTQNYDGGLICDKCTLLNEEAAKICDACGATLGMVYSAIIPTKKNNREFMRRISQLEFPPLC